MPDSVLEDLREQIASHRAVLVLGSGVTAAATRGAPTSSWLGLLRHGVERCVELEPNRGGSWRTRVLDDIASGSLGELIAGASKVRWVLREHNEWTRWLDDAIGKLEATQFDLLDAIGALGVPVLTTNYDDLVDRRLNRASITWKDAADQIAFGRQSSSSTILHLHGYWRRADTVILDFADYERVVAAELPQAVLRVLAGSMSLVFIGCGDGLSDPNFSQFLTWTGTVLRDARHRHFRLERQQDVSARQQWHLGRQDRVRVLPYGESYDALPTFLRSLNSPHHPVSSGAVTVPPPPAPPSEASRPRPVIAANEYIRLQEKGRSAVSRLAELATRLGWESISVQAAELAETLEQDLYRVAITGRSRAGKSSLTNALVGREICPVERTITTAIPIIIGPGEHEQATVTFKDAGQRPLHLEPPLDAALLRPYADQRQNPANRRGVDRISVRLADQVLALGVEYVDIPGFDDPTGEILTATNATLDAAHALVLVVDISTHATGGFTFDMGTRKLLEVARDRGRPVLVVCNKADTLSDELREDASTHVDELLTAFGVRDALARPPFFLSAKAAADARAAGAPSPAPFAAFESALWQQLWATDAVGLRRLFRVFDALRVADDSAAALISARVASEEERTTLRDAIARCRRDEERMLAACRRDFASITERAQQAFQSARAGHDAALATYIDALPAGTELPRISDAAQTLRPSIVSACRQTVDTLAPSIQETEVRVERAVAKTITSLRDGANVSSPGQKARATLSAIEAWTARVRLPEADDGGRARRTVAAGGTTGLALFFAVGGPVGALLGAGLGLVVSALVGHVTDRAESQDDLRKRLTRIAANAFATFENSVNAALAKGSDEIERRARARIDSLLRDLEARLESVREPTTDELRWHHELHETTDEAMRVLVSVLGDQEQARGQDGSGS